MKKYLKEYINYIEKSIEDDNVNEEIINQHLIKINFFQHERLIHLLVTLAYSIMFIISMTAAINSIIFCFVGLLLTCFLLPYVIYYFYLEKRVQYLYKLYDKMRKLV